MQNSIDIAFVSSAFIFVPPKEAKNIAPGVNPGDSFTIFRYLWQTTLFSELQDHGASCHTCFGSRYWGIQIVSVILDGMKMCGIPTITPMLHKKVGKRLEKH
jgi:hypothetical protein